MSTDKNTPQDPDGTTGPAQQVERELLAERGVQRKRRRHSDVLEVVTALQDALLPTELPVVPGLDMEARYLLAGSGAVGGDWFDAVVRPDGRVALVVGDVVGHGVGAAAVMGQLRAVLHSQLLLEQPLSRGLEVLDLFAERQLESHATTVCVVELDADTGLLEYCTAGHPPPLIVSNDGEARFLAPTGSGPLATGTTFALGAGVIGDGDLVVMYTDGLVQRPGQSSSEGTVQLSEVVRESARNPRLRAGSSPRPVERVCQTGLEMLTRETGYDDDFTLLAAQRRPAPRHFSTTLDATLATVPAARDAVSDWLAPLGISGVDDLAVRHAVGELVTNAVLHSHAGEHPPQRHSVDVDASVDGDGVLACTVHDDGHWRDRPDGGAASRGLGMVNSMVDHLLVDPQSTGTTATFRHRLTRVASLFTAELPTPTRAQVNERPLAMAVDGARITLGGTLDGPGAERLRSMLHRAGRGGTASVRVDLTSVTYLGSAGVRVLHEVLRDHAPTILVAPAGSVAQHVLDLVQLPYQTGIVED